MIGNILSFNWVTIFLGFILFFIVLSWLHIFKILYALKTICIITKKNEFIPKDTSEKVIEIRDYVRSGRIELTGLSSKLDKLEKQEKRLENQIVELKFSLKDEILAELQQITINTRNL